MKILKRAAAGGVSTSTLSATSRSEDAHLPPLAGHNLRDVINDVRSRGFCGPTAVAAITGEPLSVVRDAFRLARHGKQWIEMDRAPAITGTYNHEVTHVLKLLGYTGTWVSVLGNPTLAKWLNSREGFSRTHPCVVEVTGHYVAVSGWLFCDTLSKGLVVDADKALGRRKRVKRVFIILDRVPRREHIPTKPTKARAASSGRARTAFCRKVTSIGATYELDDPGYPRDLAVNLVDGRQLWMRHEGDWDVNLWRLNAFLDDPASSEFETIGTNQFWVSL